jgi:hypothetical protein
MADEEEAESGRTGCETPEVLTVAPGELVMLIVRCGAGEGVEHSGDPSAVDPTGTTGTTGPRYEIGKTEGWRGGAGIEGAVEDSRRR